MKPVKVPYLCFAEQFRESENEIMDAVRKVFERGDFILGREVELFEQEFAKISEAKYAVSVANGTDALILALRIYGIGAGDEVITASNSWVSSASAPALLGATPVFADVGPDQLISPEKIEAAITPRTKAIIPVHLTGRCADLKKIIEIGHKHGIPVIEDAAQAVTAKIDGITAGNGGEISCFSLHPLKNLNAAGDAGIITTNDPGIAEKLRLLRHHGLKNREEIVCWGYNSRLDTLQAAVLRTRLPKLPQITEKRRANAQRYHQALKSIVECPLEKAHERHTYHVYVIQCDQRDSLKAFLSERGIDTKIHYPIPIHQQHAAGYLGYGPGSLPETERQSKRILSLPIHQFLSHEQIDYVSDSIKQFFQGS